LALEVEVCGISIYTNLRIVIRIALDDTYFLLKLKWFFELNKANVKGIIIYFGDKGGVNFKLLDLMKVSIVISFLYSILSSFQPFKLPINAWIKLNPLCEFSMVDSICFKNVCGVSQVGGVPIHRG
jgi:hypothetical protein